MNRKEMEEQMIQAYQRDEGMMILVFAQWCVNHGLDAQEIYQRAYPNQVTNPLLAQMMDNTVPKEEAEEIPDATLLGVLSLFGNDDLAFVVSEEMERLKKHRG
ncbi:hypothetical protein [Brevibacillus choshinensis]|uniref:YxiS n=1 Tax=Brevibacillus choshinensis TaxID=54911 RepID=A0ABR5N6V6_BRECH|nr:hypothetical protein [Brevibacillus choshinensis]KQL46359.1 hypothetical protein AN963_15475 [Brevibacillus choshinensis]MED4583878.1 hypothetical protein [Brevibacillus choshinensis]MED4752341.1 hypothetical protein [Brevibacillus choshinensis]MED4783820.1 hypothetical protein [Brevibacillus choshinensis]